MPAKRMAGFRRVVDVALQQAVDAVLIAGDLFDNARISDSEIEAALEQLARLTMPVVLTPGNHDCLLAPSVYGRVDLARLGPSVHFLDNPEGGHLVLEELQLTLWARALVDHHPGHNPLAGYTRLVEEHWQVALAHGHFVATGQRPDRSSPLRQEQIGELQCDYLALGHWHRFLEVSHGGTPAFYPGSPSEPGDSYTSTNLVTLSPRASASVRRIPIEI